jgi:hypothetical protein
MDDNSIFPDYNHSMPQVLNLCSEGEKTEPFKWLAVLANTIERARHNGSNLIAIEVPANIDWMAAGAAMAQYIKDNSDRLVQEFPAIKV